MGKLKYSFFKNCIIVIYLNTLQMKAAHGD